ncbi:YncE family protein [Rhizobium sp. SYY.PMSO]|uniref:YncE family protein n=1 Tax=Rhizobium sp. SYY.PMSO TaxID=3382192 RepID=UPI00398FB4AF
MLIEKSSHCLSFYDCESGALVDSIPLPEFPHEFVVDSAQRYAYVAHYGVRTSSSTEPGGASILVIDLVGRKLQRRIDCRPFYRLHGIGMDRLDRLYALSETAGVLLRFDDPPTAELPSRAVVSGGLKSHLFALSRDGRWAYCINLLSHTVTKISPQDATIAPVAIIPGEKPEGTLLSGDEKTLYVSNRLSGTIVSIDTETMEITRRASCRTDPARIYALPGDRLLIANYEGRSASLLASDTLEEIGLVQFPGRPAAACVDDLSNTAFLSLDTNQSVRLELETMRIVGSFDTKAEPDCCFLLAKR